MPADIRRCIRSLFPAVSMLGGFCIALGLAEFMCALFAPATYVTTDILGRKIRTRDKARHIHFHQDGYDTWDLAPGQRGVESLLFDFRYGYRVNELGLRDDPVPPRADGELRILVLGDSHTFGMGVDQDKTYPALLESKLQSHTDRPVRVLNAGVPGYGQVEALLKLKRIIGTVQPDLVISSVFVDNVLVHDMGNDLWSNYTHMPSDSSPAAIPAKTAVENQQVFQSRPPTDNIPFLARHSHLYGLLSRIKRKWAGTPTYADRIREYRACCGGSQLLADVWEFTREILRKTAAVARDSSRGSFLVLHVPGISSLLLNDTSAVAELRASRLPLVSAFDGLKAQMEKSGKNLRFAHDAHYNSLAHAVIAEKLYRGIITSPGLLPRLEN